MYLQYKQPSRHKFRLTFYSALTREESKLSTKYSVLLVFAVQVATVKIKISGKHLSHSSLENNYAVKPENLATLP